MRMTNWIAAIKNDFKVDVKYSYLGINEPWMADFGRGTDQRN
jgi:hypothetical protein